MAKEKPCCDEQSCTKIRQRLQRVEGQIRGIIRMVDEEKYCIEVLTQISAARAALQNAGLEILKEHLYGCVSRQIRDGSESTERVLSELMQLLKKQEL